MSNFIYYQFYVFLATFYGGIIIALIYDFYKVFRRIMKPGKVATIIQDLLFWIVVTAVAISVLLYSNEGSLRGYTVLGFLIGVWVYNMILSDLVVEILLKASDRIGKAIKLFLKAIGFPFKYAFKVSKRPFNKFKDLIRPYYLRGKRITTLPRRVFRDMEKYTRIIIKKKKKGI